DRLAVPAELDPGHHLDGLLQRAYAAGEGDEGVGFVEHGALPRMHVVGDDLFAGRERDLPLLEEAGDDAEDVAARREHGAGEDAHETDRAAAIDEPDAGLGEDRAEPLGRFGIGGIGAGRGTAIDANAFELHRSYWP